MLPVDHAASLGATVLRVSTVDEFRASLKQAKANPVTTVVHVETDLHAPNPPGSAWWEMPVSEVSDLDSTREAEPTTLPLTLRPAPNHSRATLVP